MRNCTTCGHQNPTEVDICLHCGVALGKNCPICGQIVPAKSKFCTRCGASLPESQVPAPTLRRADEVRQNLRALMPTALAQKISAAAGEILGEHREVTLLFVNVVNHTTAPNILDNEDTYHLMNEALKLLVEVVYKYEGTVDKFTGDGLVTFFGAPVAHENDPERAVRAAFEMQTHIQSWQARVKREQGFDFRVRMGVHTGPVVVGKVGNDLHMSYTVVGESVNLAYHLQMVAEPGTVVVSTETYQRTRAYFDFKPLPALNLKWLGQPIQTFQCLDLHARSGIEVSPGFQTQMVGRAYELAQLHQAFAATQEQGRSRVVFVTGEIGLGKSRLVAEFRRTLNSGQTRVCQGNCLTYARQNPLWVVTELLRNLIYLAETGPAEQQRQALQLYLERLGLAQPEIQPYLVHALGLTPAGSEQEARLRFLDPVMLQRQTHAALRQLLLTEAGQGSLILIFEDLHWVDPASKDFLEYLIQTSGDARLLLIFVSRQEGHQSILNSLLLAARQEQERLFEVQLRTLADAESTLLTDMIIPQNTPDALALKRQIVSRAEGNPLFVEEIIRNLIDRGGLVRSDSDGTWQITLQAHELLRVVPSSIKGLILARFDRLPENMRRTLQKAAVLGSSFPTVLLHHLLGIPGEVIQTQLGHLESWQFIRPMLFRSQPGYIFQHALLQETIYSTLLKRDRGKIHAQAAEAIKDNTFWLPEELTELLAYHYVESNNPILAVPYLISAAENAARRCAHEVAITHYRQAMSLLPEQPGIPDERYFRMRLGLGVSLKFVGEFAAASQILSETLETLQGSMQAADLPVFKSMLVDTLRLLGDVRQREGAYDQALQYLEMGLQLLGEKDKPEEVTLWRALLDRLAWIRFRRGELEEAFALASQAIAALGSRYPDDPMQMASLNNILGGICWQQGKLPEAITYVQRSLDLYERLGYLWGMATAYGNLGILRYMEGNWLRAAEYYERAYTIHQTIGNPESQAHNLDNLGVLHTATGDYETAQRELSAGLTIRKRLGDVWGTAQSQLNLACLAIAQSRVAEAAEQATIALNLSESIGSTEIVIPARWCLALVRAEQADFEDGLQLAGQALDLARSTQFVEGQIDSLRVLGTIQGLSGNYGEARATLQESIRLAQTHHATYRQGQALYASGRLYQQLAQVDPTAAEQWQTQALNALNEAAHLFEALGAGHDLRLVQLALNQAHED